MYYPLHVHTAIGSIGDSILKIEEYIEKIKSFNLSSAAITNHGSLADMYTFYSKCMEENIKPIIGCEVYVANDKNIKEKGDKRYHLILIAKNNIGIKNLLHICNDAELVGMYHKPRTDLKTIKEHSEGLICLTACLAGQIPQGILRVRDAIPEEQEKVYEELLDTFNAYKEIFKEDFYLEIQPGQFEDQIFLNSMLCELAKDTNTNLIATNDVHYLNEDDVKAHDIHVKISRKQKLEDAMVYPDSCYYVMDHETIKSLFVGIPEDVVETAINNTVKVAEQCNITLDINTVHMPKFDVQNTTEDDFLEKYVLEAFYNRMEEFPNPAFYMERILHELHVLKVLGFSGYILTVQDLLEYARKEKIAIGPGRGSVCGSLIAYLCDITVVDPIKYDLLFERFLSEHRLGSIPDIDMDISSEHRQAMFDYTIKKYGYDNCAQVSAFGYRKAKAALRDIARVFDIENEIADAAAKLIPISHYDEEGNKAVDLSIADSIEIVPELKNMYKQYPDWFDMAMRLEDLPKVSSIHAAGTLVAPIKLGDSIPLRKKSSKKADDDESLNISATSLNLKDAEMAGFVKYDFLALSTLSIIQNTQEQVGFKFDFDDEAALSDPKVWALIGSKNTTTLFQIGSKTYKDRMFRLAPKTIDQLAACLALVRGPCIQSKADEKYMQIIEGTQEVELIHPFYDEATKNTNGILLYQEDLMKIAVNFGFSLEDSFVLMKAVAKKKKDKIQKFKAEFIQKAIERNVSQDVQERVWKIIEDAGLYLFNASHAVAYALLTYQTAYLKTYFPLEYMANALTNAYKRKEEIEETVQECRRLGIKFNTLDYNTSLYEFTVNKIYDNMLNIGMCAIKNFGKKASDVLIANRPYESFEDLMERIPKKDFNKRVMVPGIYAGLFNSLDTPENIHKLYSELRKEEPNYIMKVGKDSLSLQETENKVETFILSAPLLTSPVNDFVSIGFDEMRNRQSFSIKGVINRVKKIKDRNGNQIAFLSLETGDGIIDATIFSNEYCKYKKMIKKGSMYTFQARKDKENSCIVSSITA